MNNIGNIGMREKVWDDDWAKYCSILHTMQLIRITLIIDLISEQ